MPRRIVVGLMALIGFAGVAACTPEEIEAAKRMGIDPALVAQAEAQSPFQVVYPAPKPEATTTTTTVPPTTATKATGPATTLPPPPPPPTTTTTTTMPTLAQPSDDALYRLRMCESTNDYGAVSAGGTYRGAYQFNRSTWDSVAARWYPWLVGVDPAAASPAQQDAMARALYAERGAQPWPHCGRYL